VKHRNVIILAGLLCFVLSTGLLAAAAGSDYEDRPLTKVPGNGSGSEGLGWDFGMILIALAVVIAGIYLLLRVLRRFFPKLAVAGGAGAPVKPLARFHLAPRQTLHLVRCGSRLLLLGATSASINHITTIEDKDEIEGIVQAIDRGQSPLSSLSRLFHRSSQPPSDESRESAISPEKLKD